MSTIEQRYLKPGRAYNDGKSRLPDLRFGGQFGYAANLSELVSTTPYIAKDIIVNITRYPGMYDLMPDGDLRKETLKQLVEVHTESITGFDRTITLGTSDVVISASGAKIRPVNESRINHSDLTLNYAMDFQGEPIKAFWSEFIRIGIWDPYLQRPAISTLELEEDLPGDWTLDMYTWDMVCYEPDVHFKYAHKAWEIWGCHPLTGGDDKGAKDPLNAKSVDKMAFPITGIDISNNGTKQIAQAIMDKVKIVGANPYNLKSPLTEEQIKEVVDGKGGYFSTLENVKAGQIKST